MSKTSGFRRAKLNNQPVAEKILVGIPL